MSIDNWVKSFGCRAVIPALASMLVACGGGGGFAHDDGGTFGTAINPPPSKVLVQGAVYDDKTGAPLRNIEVSDSAPGNEEQKSIPIGTTYTDTDGRFALQARPDQNRDIALFFRSQPQSEPASFSLEGVPENVEKIEVLVDLGEAGSRATPRDIQISLRDSGDDIPNVRERQHLDIIEGRSGHGKDDADFDGPSAPIGRSVDDVDLVP